MKSTLLLLILLPVLAPMPTQAQTGKLESVHLLDSLEALQENFFARVDSLQLPTMLTHTLDSIKRQQQQAGQWLDELETTMLQQKDSLPSPNLEKLRQAVAKQKKSVLALKDSLMPGHFYQRLDSLKGKVTDPKMQQTLDEVDQIIGEQQEKVTTFIAKENLEERLNIDIQELDRAKELISQLNEYNGKLDEVASSVTPHLPKGASADVLKGRQVPGFESINLDTEQFEVPSELAQVEDYMTRAGDASKQMQSGNIDEVVGEHAKKVGELQALEEQAGALKATKAQFETETAQVEDPDWLKREAAKRAQVLANDMLKDHSEVVQEAMQSMETYKKKYAAVQNSKDVEEGIEKPEKHIDREKRWFFGGNFQFNATDPAAVDVSPLVQYRLSMRLSAGLGGTYRYTFDETNDYVPELGKEAIYGFRFFLEWTAIKGFYVHGEYERMHQPAENKAVLWQENYLAGVGRQFAIGKKLKGNIQALYHINHKKSDTYKNPLVFRIGFLL
jgi:hypothetical protein